MARSLLQQKSINGQPSFNTISSDSVINESQITGETVTGSLNQLSGRLVEDFITPPNTFGTIGIQIGNNGGSSGVTSNTLLSTKNTPGVWQGQTGTGIGGRAFVFFGGTATASTPGDILVGPGVYASSEWVIQIPTLTTAINSFFTSNGLTDSPNGGSSGLNGFIFRTESGGVDLNFRAVVRFGGADVNNFNTGITTVAGEWYRIKVEADGGEEIIRWYIGEGTRGATLNDVAEIPFASLPAGLFNARIGHVGKIQSSAGIVNKLLYWDLLISTFFQIG